MPNQRAEDQTLVAFALDQQLLSDVESARRALRLDRSTFIRIAVIEALQKRGFNLSLDLAYAPDRAGKGGRSRIAPRIGGTDPSTAKRAVQSMDAAEAASGIANSSATTPMRKALTQVEEEVAARHPSRGLKPTAAAPSAQTAPPVRAVPRRSNVPPSWPENHPKK